MLLDVNDVALLHGKPLAGVLVAEPLDEGLHLSLALSREVDPVDALRDLLVDLHGRRRLEGRVAAEQLEGEDSQRPPVNRVRVPLGGDELRSEVVGGAARGVRLADDHLGQTHVRQLHLAQGVEQQVLRLQVPEDDLLAVQVLERESRAGHVELGAVLPAPQVLLVVSGVELAPKTELKEQVEHLVSVERLVQLDDEGRVAHHLDVLLAHDAGLHAGLHDVALAQAFQGVHLPGLGVLDQVHDAEAAAAEQAQLLEVLADDVARALAAAAGVGAHLGDLGRAGLASLLELLKGSEQHVEGCLVDRQERGAVRRDIDGGRARLAGEERPLTEELRLGGAGRGRQLCDLLAVLDDAHRAVDEDVEQVALLALVEDWLVLAEGHLVERLGELLLLIVLERIQELDPVQVLDVLLGHLVGGIRQDVLELRPVDDHHSRTRLGNDGRGARCEVHERELAETLALCQLTCAGRRGVLGALPLGRDQDLEGAVHHDVEVVGIAALLDDLGPLRHFLLPHDLDHGVDPVLLEVHNAVQVRVRLQGRLHGTDLVGSLVTRRLLLHSGRPSADGPALRELQLVLQAERLELLAADRQRFHLGLRLDRGRPGLVAEQRVLAEEVAGLQLRHHRAVDFDSARALLDDVELVALFVALLNDGLPRCEALWRHRVGEGLVELLRKALE
mmetsp:Transcript_137876/g.428454  ORF Transcript_137876/g.428454 Transcript_137876/m.428454 type:complete len:674 (+) Transcript_137876:532-2553(+)